MAENRHIDAAHWDRARVREAKETPTGSQHWAAFCGGGLALLPCFRADAEPALRRIGTPTPIPSAEIWLGVHRENLQVPRVRTVLDSIAETVRSRAAVLDPVPRTAASA